MHGHLDGCPRPVPLPVPRGKAVYRRVTYSLVYSCISCQLPEAQPVHGHLDGCPWPVPLPVPRGKALTGELSGKYVLKPVSVTDMIGLRWVC